MILSAARSHHADDQPPPLPTRARPAGGLRPAVRPAAWEPGPAPRPARLPARPAAAPRPQQDPDRPGRCRADYRGSAPRGPAAAMVPVGVELGPRAGYQQRIGLLQVDPATAPHGQGMLVIDDTGDRKDGSATAHVARQYLGSVGKTDNGIVAVTGLWADGRCYWPLHAVPYTPASRLPAGERDPAFRTKPQLAIELVQAAQQAGIG